MEKFIYITLFSFIFINLNAQISILNKEIVSETKKIHLVYTLVQKSCLNFREEMSR